MAAERNPGIAGLLQGGISTEDHKTGWYGEENSFSVSPVNLQSLADLSFIGGIDAFQRAALFNPIRSTIALMHQRARKPWPPKGRWARVPTNQQEHCAPA